MPYSNRAVWALEKLYIILYHDFNLILFSSENWSEIYQRSLFMLNKNKITQFNFKTPYLINFVFKKYLNISFIVAIKYLKKSLLLMFGKCKIRIRFSNRILIINSLRPIK